MVNFKETIINLNKAFPEWDLNTLLKIIECIVEQSNSITYPTCVKDLTSGITYTTTK